MLNDTPHSLSIKGKEALDRLRAGKPPKPAEPKPKAKRLSLTDRMAAAVERLKVGEAIRKTKSTWAWDGTSSAVAAGTVTSLIAFGYLKGDPATVLFDDNISQAQLWVWTGKEYAA